MQAIVRPGGASVTEDHIRDALDKAHAAHFHPMVARASLLLGNPSGAEDLVHDAFLVAMNHARSDPSRLDMPLEPWLYGILARLASNRRRALRREIRRVLRLERGAVDRLG